MGSLQVKDIPDRVHRKIRRYAERHGRTIREVVLDAVMREIRRDEFAARLAKRAPVDLGSSVTRALHEVRAERDTELGA